MSGKEVIEGFVCALCMRDLGSKAALERHFETAHGTASTSKARSFLDKARAKVQQRWSAVGGGGDSGDEEDYSYLQRVVNFEEQTLGKTRSHTSQFRKRRKERTTYLHIQTNKMLMRLDKLLYAGPKGASGSKRKEYEKTVVEWLDERLVPKCPDCHVGFGMMRRRHHCRLCGAVVCQDCSKYLFVEAAVKVLKGAYSDPGSTAAKRRSADKQRPLHIADECIRICPHCELGLEQTNQGNISRSVKQKPPPVVELYKLMAGNIAQAEKLLPPYYRLLTKLQDSGEDDVYDRASKGRAQLLSVLHHIDSISKKINGMNRKSEKVGQGTLKLQHSIRSLAVNYLTEHMIALQDLPSKAQLKEIRERKAAAAARRREAKEAARRARQAKREEMERQRKRSNGSGRSHEYELDDDALGLTGGSGSDAQQPESLAAPDTGMVLEQCQLLRGFITEAKAGGRLDEVQALEAQLRVFEEMV